MRSALAAQAIIIQEAADTPAATKADAVIINEPWRSALLYNIIYV